MGIEQEPQIPHASEITLENGVPGLRGKNDTFVPLTTEVGVEIVSDKTSIRIEPASKDIGATALAGQGRSDIPAGFWGIVCFNFPREEE